MDTYDVYICHQHKAKKVVEYMAKALRQAGISCWYAPRDLGDGQNRDVNISKSISNASCVIAVISDEALSSQWINNEISFADDHNIPIIPFELAPISIQNGLTLRLATKKKIIAYENPSNSIETLIITINNILSSKEEENSVINNAQSNEVGTKSKYSILQNAKGEIMIMMKGRVGQPQNPRFIYDGKDTALLYRNQDSSVAFRNIDEDARNPLKSVSEVLIVEIINEEVEREYIVPVRLVRDVHDLIIE